MPWILAPLLCLALLPPTPARPVLALEDWASAAASGWRLRDQSRGGAGRATLANRQLTLEQDADADVPIAEAAWPKELEVAARFSVEFRARFDRLGLADDGTGNKSLLRLQVGAKTPEGAFGTTLHFTFDRYHIEESYKVLRTDRAWHRWRIEFDARRRTAALFRDGEYLCLHRSGSTQPAGLYFQLRGSKEVPARAELAEVRVLNLPEPAAPRRRPPAFSAEPAPGDWPFWRRDTRNSGLSPLRGAIRQPEVRWSVPVGAETATPTRLGGISYFTHSGNLTAVGPDGATRWSQRLDNAAIYGLADLDGDGADELVVAAGTPAKVQVLDPKDGRVRYLCPQFPRSSVAAVRLGKLNPQKKGLQAVVWSHQHEKGYCLSFADGVEQGQVDWVFDWKMSFFTPTTALADMDRDGALDLVVVTYSYVAVYDGPTGAVKMQTEWHTGRNYGTLVVKDIDGDGYPDICILADVLREHIGVARNEGGKALRPLWDSFFEQNYPDDHVALRVLTESVDDFDGDGDVEIAYSIFDDRVDRHWRTRLVDARTGKIEAELKDRYLVGADRPQEGKPTALVLSTPRSREALGLERLALWSATGGKWSEVRRFPPGVRIAPTSLLDFAPHTWAQVSGIATGVPTRFRVAAPSAASPAPAVAVARAGVLTVPVVARLRPGEAPSVCFIDSDGKLRCIRVEKGKPVVKWSRPAQGCWSYYVPFTRLGGVNGRPLGIPVLADIDSDGTREILVGEKPNRLVALDSEGVVRKTWTFPAVPQWWSVGEFDGDGAADLFVVYPNGAILDVISGVVSGRTGKMLWKSHCGNGPPALFDLDGDGSDDVVLRDLYERRTLHGTTGRDLQPILMQQGYHTPVIPQRPGTPYEGTLWTGGGWALARDRADGEVGWRHWLAPTGTGAVADVDGDGRREVGMVTAGEIYPLPVLTPIDGPNQEFLCYDAETGERRWSLPLGTTSPGIVVGDVDGDGKPEFVFGTADGRLIALGGEGRVRWEKALPAALGMPILADVDGDGGMEVLVSCADGNLYLLADKKG